MARGILFCANDFVMIETLEIFWSTKIELRVIILAVLIIFGLFFWRENKRKQKEKQQARLNAIKTN